MVLKIKKEYAIVMTQESDLIRIQYKQGMEIGQKIYFMEEDIVRSQSKKGFNKKQARWVTSIAAMLIIVVMTSLYVPQLMNPVYAVVSVDVNPSVQLKIDKHLNVVSAEAELLKVDKLLNLICLVNL